MNHVLDRVLSQWPRWLTLLASVLGVGLVGVADFLTGAEISFSIFYLLPIALGAWYGGRAVGLATAAAASFAWLTADLLADQSFSHALIPLWNAAVRLALFGAIAAMLSELRRRLDLEERLARTDPLTGVLNGRAFRERAEAELERARRYGRPFALAYVDADNFKQLNDQLGHQTGDLALAELVDAIRGELRETDVVARLGGDELVVLLIESGEKETRAVTGRLLEAVRARMARAGWPVTVSVGVVTFERPPKDVAEMIRLADEQMYAVKRAGKDGVAHRVFPPPRDGVPVDPRQTRPLRRRTG